MHITDLIARLPKLSTIEKSLFSIVDPPEAYYKNGGKLQQGIPAISLVSGIAFPTAFGNDVNPEYVFAQQIFVLGKSEDVLFAISTSGNSPNVVAAAQVAKVKG